jgi:hypothetical protein
MSIVVLDPTPGEPPRPATLAPRLPTLNGRTIALLDTGKKNVAVFLDQLEAALRTEHGVVEAPRRRKANQNAPAAPALIAELALADGVISAVGD